METVLVVIALTYPTPMREAVLEEGPMSPLRTEGRNNGGKTKAWSSMIFLITSSHLPPLFSIFSYLSVPQGSYSICLSTNSFSLSHTHTFFPSITKMDAGKQPCSVKHCQLNRWVSRRGEAGLNFSQERTHHTSECERPCLLRHTHTLHARTGYNQDNTATLPLFSLNF